MTDKEYMELVERLRFLYDKWKSLLWLTDWKIALYCWRTSAEFCTQAGEDDPHLGGICKSSWEYKDAAIHINGERVWGLLHDLERVFAHEMLHCQAAKVRQLNPTENDWVHEEHLVTSLTDIVLALAKEKDDEAEETCNVAKSSEGLVVDA